MLLFAGIKASNSDVQLFPTCDVQVLLNILDVDVALKDLDYSVLFVGLQEAKLGKQRTQPDSFFVANVKVIYLALVEDRDMVDSLLKYQLIGLLLNMKMNPNVDFRLFLSLI